MTDHSPLTRDFRIRLIKLHRFADMVEETFVTQASALDAELTERARSFAPEQRAEFFEAHVDEYFELGDELPTVLRYSVLTAADSALESYLRDTCLVHADLVKSRLGLRDLKGTGIHRARSYLEKVASVSFPSGEAWTLVLRLHDLRNSIVHADGFVPAERQDLVRWARTMNGLHVTERGVISLSREFTPAALDAYDSFSLELDVACANLGLWGSVFPPVENE